MKKNILAQMGTVSFCGGVRHKRYSGQLETAPEKINCNFNNKIGS
ncbi:hypothetical protein [Flavobacterium pectinovorum]|nr:hypothetical protein [Flavobacterium pectinovorum]